MANQGELLIKPEFIISENPRLLSLEHAPENEKRKLGVDGDPDEQEDEQNKKPKLCIFGDQDAQNVKLSKKEKKQLKGQNKSRYGKNVARPASEETFCNNLIINDSCPFETCKFLHDKKKYLELKPKDLGEECYIFNLTGCCTRGIACRFGSKHITEDGDNIINEELHEKSKNDYRNCENHLTKELQKALRKRTYDFKKSLDVIKEVDTFLGRGKKTNNKKSNNKKNDGEVKKDNGEEVKQGNCEEVKQENGEEVKPENDSAEKHVGPLEDTDTIKLLPREKKKIEWKDKLYLSPLTTLGNLPFRRICKEYGADITCGEMVLATTLLQGMPQEWALVRRHPCEDLFGVQIAGGNMPLLTRCAQVVNENADVDFIDINMGCPIDLVYQQGAGSALLGRPSALKAVVYGVNQVIDVPLTVKLRMGVAAKNPVADQLMPIFRSAGVSLATVHGRSREQRFIRKADWDYIEKCAEAAAPMPVFGNGDILSYQDYKIARETHPMLSGAMIGRGALMKPWIFTEIKEKRDLDLSSKDRFEMLQKFTNYGLEHWGTDTRGVETTRRFLLEWLSFLYRYVPTGILLNPPQVMNGRPPYYKGRDELETLMASPNCADWIKISEMLLNKVPEGFTFLPKHKANAWG